MAGAGLVAGLAVDEVEEGFVGEVEGQVVGENVDGAAIVLIASPLRKIAIPLWRFRKN